MMMLVGQLRREGVEASSKFATPMLAVSGAVCQWRRIDLARCISLSNI